MESHNINFVITIGRQYGSGGREIGRLVAGQILTESYWKETVRLAAGFDDEGYLCVFR